MAKPEVKKLLPIFKRRWEDNIKADFSSSRMWGYGLNLRVP